MRACPSPDHGFPSPNAARLTIATIAAVILVIAAPVATQADAQLNSLPSPPPPPPANAALAPAPSASAAPVPAPPQDPNKPGTTALPPGANAVRPTGRYQAIALPRDPGNAGDKMMIVDTFTGDVWQWFDSPALSQYIGRSGVTYMGKLKPGIKPGETVTFKRYDAK